MYLTVDEYLRRNGERETILITNEDAVTPSPTYDSAKVEEAIGDATDMIDSYIGNRYAVPLVDPPKLVQNMTNALARESLHKNRMPEDVRAEADRVRAQLRDIAAGRMSLPVPESGEPPATTTGGDPMRSNDADPLTFGKGAFDTFMAPFSPGSGRGACWKGGG